MKREDTEDRSRRLYSAGSDSPELVELIKGSLGSLDSIVVAAAANRATATLCHDALPQLISAFYRFTELVAAKKMTDDPKPLPDSGCAAKAAVMRALLELDCHDEQVFRNGLGVVQYDPAYGCPEPGEETGYSVRNVAIRALANCSLDRVVFLSLIAPQLFADHEVVRQAAVTTIGATGGWEANLLLHNKVLAGDIQPEVTGEAVAQLLENDNVTYLPVAVSMLTDPDPIVRFHIVCALSESRNPASVEALIQSCVTETDPAELKERYVAIGRSRHAVAADFLRRELLDETNRWRQLVVVAVRKGIHLNELEPLL